MLRLHAVGFARSEDDNDGQQVQNAGCLVFNDGGFWKVGFSFANRSGGAPDQDWIIDVLFIKKGLFVDLRPDGRPSGAGSITNSSKGGDWS